MTRQLLMTFVLFSLSPACKQRDPEAAGLLSDGTPAAVEPVADSLPQGGAYTVTCYAQDTELTRDAFVIGVRGAVNENDEAQPIAVSVARLPANAARLPDKLAHLEAARGAVRPMGAIFLGFASGVLTADYSNNTSSGTHAGLLTLAADPLVNALAVRCTVVKDA